MVGLEAADRGEFTMIPIIAPGKTLKIDAVTQRTGSVRVEVAGIGSRSFAELKPLFGDLHWAMVGWRVDPRHKGPYISSTREGRRTATSVN